MALSDYNRPTNACLLSDIQAVNYVQHLRLYATYTTINSNTKSIMTNTYQRPSKDESFMEIAESVSMRATCLRRRYGAVIVSRDGRIVSTGYNGAPRHRANCCDLGSCLRDELHVKPGTHYELCRSVHAEANAIINGNPLDIIGGTLYLAGTDASTNQPSKYISPCAMCQRLILNAQIARVVMRDANRNLVEVNPLDWNDDSELIAEHRRNLQAQAQQEQATNNNETSTNTSNKEQA